jgi:hypothetical protein
MDDTMKARGIGSFQRIIMIVGGGLYSSANVVIQAYPSIAHSNTVLLLSIAGGGVFAIAGGIPTSWKSRFWRFAALLGITGVAEVLGFLWFALKTDLFAHGDFESWVLFKLFLTISVLICALTYAISLVMVYVVHKVHRMRAIESESVDN